MAGDSVLARRDGLVLESATGMARASGVKGGSRVTSRAWRKITALFARSTVRHTASIHRICAASSSVA